jgi:hypothetical protein
MTNKQNFFFLDSHGEENLEHSYEIPEGVRLVIYNYSKESETRKKFHKYSWSSVLLDNNNYYDFLIDIYGYSSIRDNFFIYEQGDVITNLDILVDEFKEGLHRLPVKGYIYDNNKIVLSQGVLISELTKNKKFMKNNQNSPIIIDSQRLVKLMKDKKHISILHPNIRKLNQKSRLSTLIASIKINNPSFTLLIIIDKDKKQYSISKSRNIVDELKRYKAHSNLQMLITTNI